MAKRLPTIFYALALRSVLFVLQAIVAGTLFAIKQEPDTENGLHGMLTSKQSRGVHEVIVPLAWRVMAKSAWNAKCYSKRVLHYRALRAEMVLDVKYQKINVWYRSSASKHIMSS